MGITVTQNTTAITVQSGTHIDVVAGRIPIRRVMVSADDSGPGYLEDQVVAGDGVDVSVVNPGGNEQLTIAADVDGLTDIGAALAAADEIVVYDDSASAVRKADVSRIGTYVHAGAVAWTGVISPAQLTADAHDWSPTGLADAAIIRVSTDAARSITGIAGGSAGRLLLLVNVGAYVITLPDADAGSTAINRFALPADLQVQPDAMVLLSYDDSGSRWRSAGGGGTGRVLVSADDTTVGYLEDKIVAGDGMAVSTANPAANEEVELAVYLPGLTDIGAGLADADEIVVYDDSASAHRRSDASRIRTYCQDSAQAWTGVVSPAQLTADQNNWNPTGLAGAAIVRVSSDAARVITGLAGGSAGRLILLHNVGGYTLTLTDQDSGSTDLNRFDVAASNDYELLASGVCFLSYDATSLRWRIIGGGVTSATDLSDTPGTITANRALVGNSGGTAYEASDADPDAHAARHADGSDDIQNATASQKGLATAAQITKLDGIEASADVTDATNVSAAGATMDTDTDVSGNSWVLDEDDLSSDSAEKVPTQQSVKAYVDGKDFASNVIWEYEVTGSAVQTINVDTGTLNHDRLKVMVDVVNGAGSAAVYDLYINNSSGTIDTTQANYTTTLANADNDNSPTNQTAEYDQPRFLDCAANDDGRAVIDLTTDSVIVGLLRSTRRDGTKNHTLYTGCIEYETTKPSQITELRLYASVASGFGVGTKVTIIDPTAAQNGRPDVWRNEETLIPGEWWQDPDNTDDYYPRYRKCVDFGSLPNSTTKDVAHGITNYHLNSVGVVGYADDGSTVSFNMPYVDPATLGSSVSCYLTGSNIRVKTGSDRTTFSACVEVVYSKTTDTPVTYAQAYGNGSL